MKSNSRKTVKKPVKNVRGSSGASKSVLQDASQHLMNTYRRSDMIFTHGRGCYVFDQTGKKYLDFLGGIAVNALGYSYPDLVKTIRREAGRAVHVSNLFHNPFQGPLAAKLAQMVRHGPRIFLQQRFRSHGRRVEAGAHRREAETRRRDEDAHSWRSKIPFTDARSARFRSRIPLKYRSRSSRSCLAWNLSA